MKYCKLHSLGFTCIIFCMSFVEVRGQILYDNITIENGLPSNDVNAITKDRNGYIWLATANGIARFDGYRYKSIQYQPEGKSGLKGNNVHFIHEDKAGNLWICQSAGLSKLNPHSWEMESYFFADSINGSKYDWEVFRIYENKDGTFLAATSKGLREFDENQKLLLPFGDYPLTDSINTFWASRFIDYDENKLIIGTSRGIVVMNKNTGKYKRYHFPMNKENKDEIPGIVSALYMDENKKIWIGWYVGPLTLFDPHSGHMTPYELIEEGIKNDNMIIYDISKSHEKNQMLISDYYKNIWHFNTQNFTWEKISPDIIKDKGICKGIFCDDQKKLWLCTNNGIFTTNPRQLDFKTFKLKIPQIAGNENNITGIFKDDLSQEIFISTGIAGNIFKYDKSKNRILSLPEKLKNLCQQRWQGYSGFELDSKSNLWIGGNNIIHKWNEKKNILQSFRADPQNSNTIAEKGYNSVFLSSIDKIYFYSNRNLKYYDENNGQYEDLLNTSIYSGRISSIYEDDKKQLWVARSETNNHLKAVITKINQNTFKQHHYVHPIIESCIHGTGRSLTCVLPINSEEILVGTSFGLFYGEIVNHNLKLNQFNSSQGFFASQIVTMQKDKMENIWILTSDGLYIYRHKNSMFIRLTKEDGMLSNQANSISVYADHVYLAYNYGYFQELNSSFLEEHIESKIAITGIKIHEEDIDYVDRIIRLNHDENRIRFEFSSFQYGFHNQIKYRFKLDGIEPDFILTSDPFIQYNNLPSGKYTFYVSSQNSNGSWNKAAEVKIEIKAPFWATTWFKLLMSGVIIFFSYSFYKSRVNIIQRENLLKQQRMEAEMTALRSQMNPHFIFNCLNTIDSYIITNKAERASDLLQKFSKLIRFVLENSSKNIIPIEVEIATLEIYLRLERELMEEKFDYIIQLDDKIRNQNVKIPTMAIQPYIENAILHGIRHRTDKAGMIKILISKRESNLYIVIEDNGVGRKAATEINKLRTIKHNSKGLALAEKRLYNFDHNCKIIIEDLINGDEIPSGTKVNIILKCHNEK